VPFQKFSTEYVDKICVHRRPNFADSPALIRLSCRFYKAKCAQKQRWGFSTYSHSSTIPFANGMAPSSDHSVIHAERHDAAAAHPSMAATDIYGDSWLQVLVSERLLLEGVACGGARRFGFVGAHHEFAFLHNGE
jgi:hypothetical protein